MRAVPSEVFASHFASLFVNSWSVPTLYRRPCWQTTELSLSHRSTSPLTPSWEQIIWLRGEIIRKQSDKREDLIKRLSPDYRLYGRGPERLRQTCTASIIKESSTTITIDEGGIWNTVSNDPATIVPFEKYAKQKTVYTSKESVDERDDKGDKTGERSIAEHVAIPSREKAFYCILHHAGKDYNFQ